MNQVNLNHCEIHQEMEYIIVCFNSSCDGKRIGCAKCIQDNHHQHPQDCIFIEDIMNVIMNYSPIRKIMEHLIRIHN